MFIATPNGGLNRRQKIIIQLCSPSDSTALSQLVKLLSNTAASLKDQKEDTPTCVDTILSCPYLNQIPVMCSFPVQPNNYSTDMQVLHICKLTLYLVCQF